MSDRQARNERALEKGRAELAADLPPGLGLEQSVAAVRFEGPQFEEFNGPIPGPEDLAAYGASGADIPNRIVVMAEAEQRHRHDIERTMVRSQVAAALVGQGFAFLSVIAGFGLAAWLAYLKSPGLATGVSLADVAVIAGIFIGGRVKARKTEAGAESKPAGK